MLKIIPMLLLCAFASQTNAVELEIAAEGWDNYGSILKYGVSESKNKVNMKYLDEIASSMIQMHDRNRDQFLDHELEKNVKPKIVAALKEIVAEQIMPSDKVQYKLRGSREDDVRYHFKSERLCINSGFAKFISHPHGGGFISDPSQFDSSRVAQKNWRALIDSKIGFSLSDAAHEPRWFIGFEGRIFPEKEGAAFEYYCIKLKDTVAAKKLKSDFSQQSVIAIIDAKITKKGLGREEYGDLLFGGLTKPTHAKIMSVNSNEILYETDDVILDKRDE